MVIALDSICRPTQEGKQKLTFRRALLATDWTRFDFHSRRIWQLGLEPHEQYALDRDSTFRALGVHSDVFTAHPTYRPTKDLLLNLRKFCCNHYGLDMFVSIQAFLGPNLRFWENFNDMKSNENHSRVVEEKIIPLLSRSTARLSPWVQTLAGLRRHKIFGSVFTSIVRLRDGSHVPPHTENRGGLARKPDPPSRGPSFPLYLSHR